MNPNKNKITDQKQNDESSKQSDDCDDELSIRLQHHQDKKDFRKVIDQKCREIIGDKYLQERFTSKISHIK